MLWLLSRIITKQLVIFIYNSIHRNLFQGQSWMYHLHKLPPSCCNSSEQTSKSKKTRIVCFPIESRNFFTGFGEPRVPSRKQSLSAWRGPKGMRSGYTLRVFSLTNRRAETEILEDPVRLLVPLGGAGSFSKPRSTSGAISLRDVEFSYRSDSLVISYILHSDEIFNR